MELMTELGILDREDEIEKLKAALREACMLLRVEALAYTENSHAHYTKEQRAGIAQTLESFCTKYCP